MKKRKKIKLSKEHKKNIGLSRLGHSVSLETRKKISESEKSKTISPATKKKMSKTFFKKGIVPWNKGLKGFLSGDKSPSWKGGISGWQKKIRTSTEYKEWRKKVFARDSYTCQICGQKGCRLHADHIKQFAFYPSLRLSVSNGRTLCEPCHRKTDTYSRKKA